MKEVFPGDSVHSLLSILDVITVPSPLLSPTPPRRPIVVVPKPPKPGCGCPQTLPGQWWLSPRPLNVIMAITKPPELDRGCPQALPGQL